MKTTEIPTGIIYLFFVFSIINISSNLYVYYKDNEYFDCQKTRVYDSKTIQDEMLGKLK